METQELEIKRGMKKGSKYHRHPLEIDLAVIEAIMGGATYKAAIMRKASIVSGLFDRKAVLLEKAGYLVSVEGQFFEKPDAEEEGRYGRRYAVTERARMWRLVMQRAKELAPE